MQTQTGISETNRQHVAHSLATLLADEFVLYAKTRNAHWNVEGPDFHAMHKFFESQYEQLDEMMDDVAERIRAIGHYAPATLKSYLALTHLSEQTRTKNDSQGYIHELLTDHEQVIMFLRQRINEFANEFGDAGSSDFITGLMEDHEKMAWMLRSHVTN